MKKIGKLFLALGLIFCYAGCKITTSSPVELTKIEITSQPDKTEYFAGEDLDTTGLEITATYSDESSKVVTGWTTSGYDKTKAGEQTVTVSYTENEITKTAKFNVTVRTVEVTKIEITAEPEKKEYFVGEELNTAGMKVTATYTDGTTAYVTDKVTTSGFDSTAAVDSQTITVTYEGKTATFTVKILAVELTKIEITTEPTRKEYYIGSSALNLTGMVVTATYNNGTTKDVTKDVTTSGFDSSTALESQTITVTYEGKTTTFTIKIIKPQPYSFHDMVTVFPEGTTGSYGTEATYVEFGDWPQDVVAEADVEALALDETASTTIERGYLKFVYGLDGNYYVKCNENRFSSSYIYTKDGSAVGTGSRWFKVMPIKWRVVDTAYVVDGTNGNSTAKLLVAESILTANVPYCEDYDNDRIIDDKTVYQNNYMHSQIRAYLNGYKYTGYDTTSSSNVEKTQWNNKGFLQTAFTNKAIDKIKTTKVDNSKEQMSYDGTNDINEEYACDPTDDKIFLLSEYEVTKYSKSTETYNSYGQGNSRIRVTTDFAKANNAYQSTADGFGGYWWLRSPYCDSSTDARYVNNDGNAYYHYNNVSNTIYGVVPALAISF